MTDTLTRIECSKKENLWVNVSVPCCPSNATEQPTTKPQWHTKKYLFSSWVCGVQWPSAGLAHASVVSCWLVRHLCWSWLGLLKCLGVVWLLVRTPWLYFVSYLPAGYAGHILIAMAEENEQDSKYASVVSVLHLLHIYLLIGQSKSYDGIRSQIVRALLRRQIQEGKNWGCWCSQSTWHM